LKIDAFRLLLGGGRSDHKQETALQAEHLIHLHVGVIVATSWGGSRVSLTRDRREIFLHTECIHC